jgi:hypothetical protein
VAYEPKLPEGVTLPPGFKVDTTDPRYVALHDLATRERLSQSAFSQILGVEAQRVNAEYERARATPAPTPAAPAAPARPALPENFSKLSAKEQFAHALSRSTPTRQPLP